MKRNLRLWEYYALTKHKLKQFKIRYISLLAVLTTMCLYAVKQVSAQEAEPAATAVPDSITSVRDTVSIEEVQVNTGYQRIPKERATGSFVQVNNKLLNRSVGPNILNRLEGVSSGVLFDRRAGLTDIKVRGISTIFSNSQPLVVLDNFPYEGDISTINPNDIESVSILRDAAAASIWGTRAGNGVIVITSKSAAKQRQRKIEVSANVTVAEKPDLFYPKQISAADYIEIERFLYEQGYYRSTLANAYANVSPVVEALWKNESKDLPDSQLTALLASFAASDVRKDMLQYLYRPSINQQYNMSVSGSNEKSAYLWSAGYDNNLHSLNASADSRFTLRAAHDFHFFNHKLTLRSNTAFAKLNSEGSASNFRPSTPYQMLADDSGNPLSVQNNATLRASYVDTAGTGRLLDWRYYPLKENEVNQQNNSINFSQQITAEFRPVEAIRIQLNYLYQQGTAGGQVLNDTARFFTRDLINRYTQIHDDGAVIYPIPMGDILDKHTDEYQVHSGRFQVSYNRIFSDRHRVDALAGMEAHIQDAENTSYRLYGYNVETMVDGNALVDFVSRFPQYFNQSSAMPIPVSTSGRFNKDRSRSYFANASYDYAARYTLSASIRRDESNIFGVKANLKGVPLWSTGAAWSVHNEPFFQSSWINTLKIRATYGYNGNVNKSTAAYLTARAAPLRYNPWGLYNTRVVNPPNPSLAWEKVGNLNFGIDYGLFGNRINGSLEYFVKRAKSLIGDSPLPPQTGIKEFRGNSANMETKGWDLSMTSMNVVGNFSWSTNALLSTADDKVTTYLGRQSSNRNIVTSNYMNPLEGYPLNAAFSFPFYGLDASGNPMVTPIGGDMTNYSAVLNVNNPDLIRYHGSFSPRVYGALRNEFSWKHFGFSFNLLFKLNYFMRNNAVFNGSSSYLSMSAVDYQNRWREPGDENYTHVPAISYPSNGSRAVFYTNSDIHIYRADHVRLQDVRVSYTANSLWTERIGLRSITAFGLINNVGILWRANPLDVDPDVGNATYPAIRRVAIGLNITL